MKKLIILIFIPGLFWMCNSKNNQTSEGNHDDQSEMEHAEGMDPEDMELSEEMQKHAAEMTESFHSNMHTDLEVDMIFQQQLKDLVNSTVSLTDVFVSSDPLLVKEEAAKVMKKLQKVNSKLLTGEAHGLWMESLRVVAHKLQDITTSDSIEVQRESLAIYSGALYFSAKAFGIADQKVYYQFCPMAFDTKGAYWLSSTEEILNPYFGDKMLHCGSTKAILN
jgi:Cu(I)/Ag(I) efflux system membrane fusion protein